MMESKMRKRVLMVGYDNVNLGDDLFFWIVCNNFPEYDFYFVTKLWSEYRRILPFPNLHIVKKGLINRALNRLFKRYIPPLKLRIQRLDAILYVGGSVFMEEDDGSCYTLKQLNGLMSIYKNRPLYIAGCNYGPERSSAFRASVAKLLAQAHSVCFRDSHSYNLFSQIEGVGYSADIVFQLDTTRYKTTKSDEVGFSIIDLRRRNFDQQCKVNYIDGISRIIRRLIADNRRVVLFSFCKNEGDLDSCNHIKSLFNAEEQEFIRIVSYDGDIDSFINEFRAVEMLYATRFHALVLGLLFQIKTIPIIYSDKSINMLNDLCLGDCDKIDIRDENSFARLNEIEPILLSQERLNSLRESSLRQLLDFKEL